MRTLLIILGSTAFVGTIAVVLAFSALVYLLGLITRSEDTKLYTINCLLSIDQFGNVLLLGDPDETISSRLGRAEVSGRPVPFAVALGKIVNKLFNIIAGQKNHILDSIEPGTFKNEIWNWIK